MMAPIITFYQLRQWRHQAIFQLGQNFLQLQTNYSPFLCRILFNIYVFIASKLEKYEVHSKWHSTAKIQHGRKIQRYKDTKIKGYKQQRYKDSKVQIEKIQSCKLPGRQLSHHTDITCKWLPYIQKVKMSADFAFQSKKICGKSA